MGNLSHYWPLCWDPIGQQWFPTQRARDAELWRFICFDQNQLFKHSQVSSDFRCRDALVIRMPLWWARWRIKSQASRLFTQPFIQGTDQRKHQTTATLVTSGSIADWSRPFCSFAVSCIARTFGRDVNIAMHNCGICTTSQTSHACKPRFSLIPIDRLSSVGAPIKSLLCSCSSSGERFGINAKYSSGSVRLGQPRTRCVTRMLM